jgi:Flp pilus assembly protein TadG
MNAVGRRDEDGRDVKVVRDRGDVMLMTTVFVVFLMFGAWALVSAGQQWGARRDAQASAAAAARAAAQVHASEVRGGSVTLDRAAANARAQAVLSASGYGGAVSVNGLTVTVVASRGIDYAFPAPGFDSSVSASATATAARGVQGDEGG